MCSGTPLICFYLAVLTSDRLGSFADSYFTYLPW